MPVYKPTGNIYAVDTGEYDDGTKIIVIDPVTYAVIDDTLSATVNVSGRTIQNFDGIAYNPVDKKFYVLVIYEEFPNHMKFLGTINLTTGLITELGPVGDMESITFTTNGTLYGVNDEDGGAAEGGIYKINTKTLSKKFLVNMGDDSDNTIVFNPTDGFIYHWNDSSPYVMSKINPKTKEVFSIPIANSEPKTDEITNGGLYLKDGTFLILFDGNELINITKDGKVVDLGISFSDDLKGFAQAYTYQSPQSSSSVVTGIKCVKFGSSKVITSGSCS